MPPTYATRPGFCRSFDQGSSNGKGYGKSHFVPGNSPGLNEAMCFDMCVADPLCHQAVFEAANSRWGVQCWLGLNTMTSEPGGSRECSNNCNADDLQAGRECKCHDTCYSKAGWPEA